jgi:hypothetical protein
MFCDFGELIATRENCSVRRCVKINERRECSRRSVLFVWARLLDVAESHELVFDVELNWYDLFLVKHVENVLLGE